MKVKVIQELIQSGIEDHMFDFLTPNNLACSTLGSFLENLEVFVFCSQMTCLYLPTVIASVIKTTNALPEIACRASAYISLVSAVCSASNLACIAFNR